MAADYDKIRYDNKQYYGTGIDQFGPPLLADRYDDRTHFILELLQNTEDALKRRPDWRGSRGIRFELFGSELRVSHFGKPFDPDDVLSICAIAKSRKDATEIGRFGIGFKSVYAFTDRPTIHSGDEDFAIESFVWPAAASPIQRHADETVIVIPLKSPERDREEIAAGLRKLGARTLLFLREIDAIEWEVEGQGSGQYVRQHESLKGGAYRTTVIGQEKGKPVIEEHWLMFSREIGVDQRQVGRVELAFQLAQDPKTKEDRITRVSNSPLAVFFPTALETNLGFLAQGP